MSQLDTLQETNVQIAQLTQLLNELRANCPAEDDVVVVLPANVQADLLTAGINVDTTQSVTGNDIKLWMSQIESQIDSLNSSQQLNMIELQSQLNKQNEASDILSQQVTSMQNATNAVVNNMK
jgi:hypothetical protein